MILLSICLEVPGRKDESFKVGPFTTELEAHEFRSALITSLRRLGWAIVEETMICHVIDDRSALMYPEFVRYQSPDDRVTMMLSIMTESDSTVVIAASLDDILTLLPAMSGTR